MHVVVSSTSNPKRKKNFRKCSILGRNWRQRRRFRLPPLPYHREVVLDGLALLEHLSHHAVYESNFFLLFLRFAFLDCDVVGEENKKKEMEAEKHIRHRGLKFKCRIQGKGKQRKKGSRNKNERLKHKPCSIWRFPCWLYWFSDGTVPAKGKSSNKGRFG